MAKLALKFEDKVLKEITLGQSLVTIGRLPDNTVQIDNLAVSGHHAKIYWETDHYVVEDNQSLNGTYVNNRKISKQQLEDGDSVLIGKHTLSFKDEWHEDAPTGHTMAETPQKPVPKMEATMVLDTKKAKELMAQMKAGGGAAAPAPAPAAAASGSAYQAAPPPPPPAKARIGTLQVISGKTDQSQYTLTGKMTVIGKSDMASIKLKGWFKPAMAAQINQRDDGYYVGSGAKIPAVNGVAIQGPTKLNDGDLIEVSGIRLNFIVRE